MISVIYCDYNRYHNMAITQPEYGCMRNHQHICLRNVWEQLFLSLIPSMKLDILTNPAMVHSCFMKPI